MSEKNEPQPEIQGDDDKSLEHLSLEFLGPNVNELPDKQDLETEKKKDKAEAKEKGDVLTNAEISKIAKDFNGEVISNPSEAVVLFFKASGDSKKWECKDSEEFCNFLFRKEKGKTIENVIVYAFGKDSKERSLNEIIDECLSYYKKLLKDYQEWRKKLDEQGIKSMHYLDCRYTQSVEGGEDDTCISPRFARLGTWTGGLKFEDNPRLNTRLCAVNNYRTTWDFKENIIMPSEFGEDIAKNQEEYASIIAGVKVAFDNKGVGEESYSKNRENLINEANELVRQRIQEYPRLKKQMDFPGSDEDFAKLLMDDVQNYLQFLDRSYEAVEKFINRIESYKN